MYWTISIFICKLYILINFTFEILTVISTNYIYLSSTLSYWIPNTRKHRTHSLGVVINELLSRFYFTIVNPDICRRWQILQYYVSVQMYLGQFHTLSIYIFMYCFYFCLWNVHISNIVFHFISIIQWFNKTDIKLKLIY